MSGQVNVRVGESRRHYAIIREKNYMQTLQNNRDRKRKVMGGEGRGEKSRKREGNGGREGGRKERKDKEIIFMTRLGILEKKRGMGEREEEGE